VLEGLPISQYREVEVTVGLNTTVNKQVDKDAYWPELPMPRESHMLPEHSQQLLRAARSGRIYKPPAPPEDDRETMEEEDETKEVQKGFTVKKWARVPRHLEDPEPEYLAKRRKGLPSQYAAINGVSALPTPMRETKVQKLDAEGNVSVYKVLVPEGQTIAGEVQEADTAVIEAAPVVAVPGTVVEGVGIVNAEGVVVANEILQQTPPRRRPPIPKKKSRRGPGRGKKKVVFAEGSTELAAPAGSGDPLAVSLLKQETGSVEPSDGGDTPMADAGDDEDGSDEDGSDEDEEMKDSPAPPSTSKLPADPTDASAIEPSFEPPKEEVKEQAPTTETISIVQHSIESTTPKDAPPPSAISPEPLQPVELEAKPGKEKLSSKDPSSSPDMPLSTISHSRQGSLTQIPTLPLESSVLAADISTDVTSTDPLPTDPIVPSEAVAAEVVVAEAVPAETVPAEVIIEEVIPTEVVPVEDVPAEEIPAEVIPTEAVPTEAIPTEAVPVEAISTEVIPTEVIPTEVIPTEAFPTEAISTEAIPTVPILIESVPTEAVPAEVDFAEVVSAEVVPVEDVAAEDIPAEVIPAEVVPAEVIPAEAVIAEAVPTEPISEVAVSPFAPAADPALLVDSNISEGEDDLLGSLERHLDKDESMGGT
jgi:hypothetical protein